MPSKILLALSLLTLIATTACKKNSGNPTGPTTDVYIAGSLPGTNGSVPAYWKNGVPVKLIGPNKNGVANAIAIAGSDIYIVGSTYNSPANNGQPASSVITYWKNGVAATIPTVKLYGYATGIAVSGTDVYITGYANNNTYSSDDDPLPIYWKNGVPDTLTSLNGHGQTMAVTATGNDVYIAGYDFDGSDATSMSWKNGVMTTLGEGYAGLIALSGSDIYVAGDARGGSSGSFFATCWKNDVLSPQLSSPNLNYYSSHASAITTSGSDVYMAGNAIISNGVGKTNATYWKNGAPVSLAFGTANAIAVSGTDVYVAGAAYDPNGYLLTTIWKNGVATTLPRNGNANAIAVVTPQ